MSDEKLRTKLALLNQLFTEIQKYKATHPETKIGYYTSSVGSILNAYREGDLGFDECLRLLQPTTPLIPTEPSIPAEGESRTPLNHSDDERVKEIRERRAKITSPPWEVGAANDYYIEAPEAIITPPRYVDANMVRPAVCKTIVEVSNQTEDCGQADAYFIANAPADIDYLLTRLGQVEAELAKQKEDRVITLTKVCR